MSIYGFNQAFLLNLMSLFTLFNTNPRFNACFKFFICITYSILLCKLATTFSTFLILILSGKKVKFFQVIHCEVYGSFWDIEHQLQENIFYQFHHCSFLGTLN